METITSPPLVANRIRIIFAPYQVDFDRSGDLGKAMMLLKQLKSHDALKVIKTWLNGWATSSRMHEDTILPCLLGCECGEDSLKHYIMCSHLFAFCKYLFKLDSCPLTRLAVKNPTISNLKIVACIFSAYHALKGQVRDGRIDVQEDSRTHIRKAWSVFAEALAAEAGEKHIEFVSFSLPKFISFLATGEHPRTLPALIDNSSIRLHVDN